ncbi:MAG: diacylglycerol kinase family protein [Bacteroidetes bacterium]|nr:MAG: diacylglycerol kinase family protein [Bacteroidota bacterium]
MLKRELRSFGFAFNGLRSAFKSEIHLRFHVLLAMGVTVCSCILAISLVEWALILLSIGLVIVAELVNTAIEKLVDLCQPDFMPLAGKIKDIAAGAVLVAALVAAIIGGIVFVPKLV